MIVTIALNKTPKKALMSKIIAKAIQWKTKSKYFHIELIVKDKWISTNSGAGSVYVNELRPLSDKYDYIDIEVDGRKERKLWSFVKSQEGKKYDWFGLFNNHILDMDFDNKDKWFCSEIVARMLKILGEELPLNDFDYDPGMIGTHYKDRESIVKSLEKIV